MLAQRENSKGTMAEANRQIGLTLSAVQRVLFEIWDPIDVNQMAPEDEYDRYAPAVLEYLWASTDREGLIAMLDGFIKQDMALEPLRGRSAAAADALFDLRDGHSPG